MNAPTKHEKSNVVTKVMRILHETCPIGAFVTLEKGRWWEISHRSSREKVGTFFRDCLADKYKSSSKNKVAQRKMKRTSNPSVVTAVKSNDSAEKKVPKVEPSTIMPSMKQVLASKFTPSTTGSAGNIGLDRLLTPLANHSMTLGNQPNISAVNMIAMHHDRLVPGSANLSMAPATNSFVKPLAETQSKVQPDEPNDTLDSLENIFSTQLHTNTGSMTANNSSAMAKETMGMQSSSPCMPTMHQVMSAQFLPINNLSSNVKLATHPFSAPASPVNETAPIFAYTASTPNLRASFSEVIPSPRPLAPNSPSAKAMIPALINAAPGPLGEDLAKRVLDELAMTDPLSFEHAASNPLCEEDIWGASAGSFYDIDDLSLSSL